MAVWTRVWEAEAPCQDATQQPAGANKGGGVEDGHVRRHRDEMWLEAEAVRREATRQPVGIQEANRRRGASGLEATGRQEAEVARQEAEAARQEEEEVPHEATQQPVGRTAAFL